MRARHAVLVLAANLAVGLLLPVQSLMLCAHGCTLQTLAAAFALYSLAVGAAEIPSGFFADLYGRGACFALSCVLGALSALALLAAHSFAVAAAGLVLYGLAAAFSSGSIDALVIEEAAHRGQPVGGVVARLAVCQCVGIALGALVGGALPSVGGYRSQLLTKAVLLVLAALLTLTLPKEGKTNRAAPGIQGILGAVRRSLAAAGLGPLLCCMGATAIVQAAVESYWQPAAVALPGGFAHPLLGVLSGGSFLLTALGGLVAGLLLRRRGRPIYFVLGSGFCLLAFVLSLQGGAAGFAVGYLALYTVLGMLSVAEQTLLNNGASDAVRASLLSVASFVVRLAGIAGSLAGSLLLGVVGIAGVWRLFAGVGLVVLGVNFTARVRQG